VSSKHAHGRSSEGVRAIRHPRTDFPELGWLGRAAGAFTEYSQTSGVGWYTETQSTRMAGGKRYLRDTNPVASWIFQNIPGIVNPALFNWNIDSQRNVRDRSLYLESEKRPGHGLGGGSVGPAPFDPAFYEWGIESQPVPRQPYWTSQWIGNDWVSASVTAAFDPATIPWSSDSQRPSKSTQDRVVSWTRSGYFVTVFDQFEFAKFPWTVDSYRQPADPYWTSLWHGTDFIPPELRAVFDPASQLDWGINSQLVPVGPYWTSQWQGNDWITPELLAQIAYDPAQENWTIQTSTYKSRAYWRDSPQPQAWMVPGVLFDPTIWPGIHIDSQRLWLMRPGRWQPDQDHAWQATNPVVPNTFNPSFTTEANALLDEGGSPIGSNG
jgi:hypothetical protein